jgi:hypothetical protein
VTVPVIGDNIYETGEVFYLDLSNPTGASLVPTAKIANGIILNQETVGGVTTYDDAPPAASVLDASASEGAGVMTFTVQLDRPSAAAIWVPYATANDPTAAHAAVAGSDYTAVNSGAGNALYFDPYTTSKTFTVPVINDTLAESDETFLVNLSAPSNFSVATLGDAQAVGTIEDNDQPVPPAVTQVFASASTWSAAFKNFLQSKGLGDATFGYAVPGGAGQLATLPWGGLDQVSVRFDREVLVLDQDLAIVGAGVANYAVSDFDYDELTHTATWTLAHPIGVEKLLLDLAAGSDGVVDGAALHLDGEWADGAHAYPSGDGMPGGDLRMRLNVLPGDTNRNGTVSVLDYLQVQRLAKLRRSAASPGTGPLQYSPFADADGDGTIGTRDVLVTRRNLLVTLPAAEPVAPPVTAAAVRAVNGFIAKSLFGEAPILG